MAEGALDQAYEDVLAAFDYFLANFNDGRPIIIASHSQGTVHGARLLADRFDNNPNLRNQLVFVPRQIPVTVHLVFAPAR